MKFQKGILDDLAKKPETPARPAAAPVPDAAAAPSASHPPKPAVLGDVEKNHLFETREEFEGSSKNYLKLFAIVIVLVVAAGAAIFYFTLPGVGDQVHAPTGAEDAVRDNFLTKQKRTATDVVFFKCDGFYWARVGVETRNDIPNPVYKIGTYSARAAQDADGVWQITGVQPASETATPCQ